MSPILPLLAAAALSAAAPRAFTGKVVGVADGDTLDVMDAGRAVRVRLFGVDCPEKRQAYGSRAKEFTSRLAFGRQVAVEPVNLDRYGRLVAVVRLPDGRRLDEELVREGLAWWYRRYAPDEAELERLEDEARRSKKGLWSDPAPIPPWQFRRPRRRPGA